jgi:hypothetical protein
MKTAKYFISLAVAVAALPFPAKANTITFLGEDTTLHDQNQSTVLAHANSFGVDSGVLPDDADLTINDRFTATGSFTDIYGSFMITQVNTASGPQYQLTFSLNAGLVLAGVGIHGGSGTSENYWSVNDATSGTNEGLFHAAFAGKSGTYATLSNFDILLEPAESATVADWGNTAMLLGFALTGLGAMRRWIRLLS